MAHPTTKQALLDESQREFDRLLAAVEAVPVEHRAEPGPTPSWSVKDLLAHLHAWHELFFAWYEKGRVGGTPALPAEGYNWKQLPALNEHLYRQYSEMPLDAIMALLQGSFAQMMAFIRDQPEEELFTPGRYTWTGNHPLAGFIIPNTASHYRWARELIRKWQKHSR